MKKRVLVVDDSLVARETLIHVFKNDVALTVVGTARNGQEALEKARELQPDVIVMDINMPHMNGIDTTREIMSSKAIPIVIVSAIWDPNSVDVTFRAMEAGAIAILRKPPEPDHPDHLRYANELTQTVRTMSEVKVITRRPGRTQQPAAGGRPITKEPGSTRPGTIEVVAIGASTGGPVALQTILSAIPPDFPAPILVVQHIATGFLEGMLDWLSRASTPTLHVAAHGQKAQPGHVYFGPNGFHLGIDRQRRLSLTPGEPQSHLCPSVAHLFDSVLSAFGSQAIGVLLTGMGKDGAAQLKSLRSAGAITIAQDANTSIVHGMPGEAIALDAADFVLPDSDIPSRLTQIARHADQHIPRERISQ